LDVVLGQLVGEVMEHSLLEDNDEDLDHVYVIGIVLVVIHDM
jgi:hypothetical protein